MPRLQLNREKEVSNQEKTKLKDLIKKYEIEFARVNGRALSKEDREYHKDDFEKYKVNTKLVGFILGLNLKFKI